ncbi:MAG: hypothetical protein IPJ13_04870 [Saprospiraceae bacterium]|nr:hypothetical protein [Saprospiraceae bacterium]
MTKRDLKSNIVLQQGEIVEAKEVKKIHCWRSLYWQIKQWSYKKYKPGYQC